MTQIKFHIFKCLLDFFFGGGGKKPTVIFCVLLHHHHSHLLGYLKHAWETCENFNKSMGSSVCDVFAANYNIQNFVLNLTLAFHFLIF